MTTIIPAAQPQTLSTDRRIADRARDWYANLRRDNTRKAYGRAVNDFLAFLEPKAFTEASASDVLAYRTYLERQRGYKPQSVNQHLAALSSFYEAVTGGNPTEGVKRLNYEAYGQRTWLEADSDQALLALPDRDTLTGKRDYALLLVFLTTGLRVAAVSGLKRGDISPQGKVTYTNKGGALKTVDMDDYTLAAIRDYLEARRDDITPESPVFCPHGPATKAVRPLSVRQIQRLVTRYCDRLYGRGHGISPHSLRHTSASHAQQHATIAEVSRRYGHKNVGVTTRYLHDLDSESGQRIAQKLGERYQGKS